MKVRVEVKFEPRDLWVGLYWTRETPTWLGKWSIYICLVPCLPIVLRIRTKEDEEA